ncbi:MAG: DUF805 domain-containing protein [Parasphingorhabdus sp.]|uniref:DUF805 domain-containing protein n=1 Tax=Parasphingorhabdus sp. TaxID=2709688 RepID=UPI0032673B6D
MLLSLRRYVDFSGRSRRKEFWLFFLFQILVHIAFIALMIAVGVTTGPEANSIGDASVITDTPLGYTPFFILIALWGIFWFAMLIPNAAVVARRFHDQGIPGIVGILLYVGTIIFSLPGIVILIFMFIEGKKGDNQYGRDPKMNENIGDVFR